ncbi:putative serine/threonine-protein kinase PBL19 [Senna tora]|uniref:Putative serine/threonine-protein kinase PBL19 n=1 Tax=Senna tora TaxID=362788 RepID=A0A834XGL7_9FABA|nr:putative serine/threonine-protein kinase PBL19 [Senna tora]
MKCFNYFTRSRRQRSSSSSSSSVRESEVKEQLKSQCSSSIISPRGIPELYEEKAHNLRVFSFAELRDATWGFSRLLKIGEGGFGSVYKASIQPLHHHGNNYKEPPISVAIKTLNKDGFQGHKQWLAEVQFLGVVDHPNLVKLIGYCAVDNERGIQRLLVYEYLPNKSLEHHLFIKAHDPLPWKTRLEIALGAAQGLAYLHEELEVQVMGTYGYAAPDYIETGHLTTKSDVWSFGVVLYEILTGRRSLDENRPKTEQKLLEWVKRHPPGSKMFSSIMDPRLEGQYSVSGARNIAKLADICLSKSAKERPTMSQVVERLKQVIQASEEGKEDDEKSFELCENDELLVPQERPNQVTPSELWKRRMAHLAKLGDHVENSNRKRFMILQRTKCPS